MARTVTRAVVVLALLHSVTAHAVTHEEEALRMSQRGAALFRAGKFRDAADLLRHAYGIFPSPILLYNLGRALDSAGDLPEAIDAYKRYLLAERDATDRGAVEARIATLEQQLRERDERERQLAEERNRPPPEPAPRADVAVAAPPAPSRARRAAPWVLFGVGAAALVAGGALGGVALSRHSTAFSPATDAVAGQSDLDAARSFGLAATISLAVGGVIAGSGLVWGIVDAVRARRASHRQRASR